jgi:hypothetical protein
MRWLNLFYIYFFKILRTSHMSSRTPGVRVPQVEYHWSRQLTEHPRQSRVNITGIRTQYNRVLEKLARCRITVVQLGWTPLHYLIILAAPAFADIISLMMNRAVGHGILQLSQGHGACYIIETVTISRLLEILERPVAHRLGHQQTRRKIYLRFLA